MTALGLDDLGCGPLARDVWTSLDRTRSCHGREEDPCPTPEQIFDAAMVNVIRGIEARQRFQILKRFIAHGSLLPSWDTMSANSADPLDDEELAACVDFISGHMVQKFQGRLAELLASAPLSDLVRTLRDSGRLPQNVTLVFGGVIRCAGRSAKPQVDPCGRVGIQGPDALVFRPLSESEIEICLLAEIKSMYVSPGDLRRQCDGHIASVRRGVCLGGRWYSGAQIRTASSSGPTRVFVRPVAWKLTRNYRIEPDSRGIRQILMEDQELPAESGQTEQTGSDAWSIRLAWSHDALRAAAFCLAHRYMRTIGTALAQDPETATRTDMSAEEAGENDFLAQLHVAIARQDDSEPDRVRRQKTIELYNVLGFGWALGHGYRDERGKPSMLYLDDLARRSAAECAGCHGARGTTAGGLFGGLTEA